MYMVYFFHLERHQYYILRCYLHILFHGHLSCYVEASLTLVNRIYLYSLLSPMQAVALVFHVLVNYLLHFALSFQVTSSYCNSGVRVFTSVESSSFFVIL